MKREEVLKSPEYWKAKTQIELYKLAEKFMAETGRNKSQLAEYLGVSKGYVPQLLNGDYDHRMSKFFELALAFGMVRKEKRIVPIVSIVFKKKTRGRKTTLLFYFLFSVSCVFYITGFFQLYWFFPIVFYILAFPNYIGFSQLYFIYWLFSIILSFSNCLYSAPVNCPIKKMAPVARSFMM